jgi:hypothetical protein
MRTNSRSRLTKEKGIMWIEQKRARGRMKEVVSGIRKNIYEKMMMSGKECCKGCFGGMKGDAMGMKRYGVRAAS